MRLSVTYRDRSGSLRFEFVWVLLMEANFNFSHRVVKLPNGELLTAKECDLVP